MNSLKAVANAFSSVAISAVKTGKSNSALKDRIQLLVQEMMKHVPSDQNNSIGSCRAIIDKAIEVSSVMRPSLDGQGKLDFKERLSSLVGVVKEVIASLLLSRESDVTFLLEFFSCTSSIKETLLENPQLWERLAASIQTVSPNVAINAEEGSTLFLKLASDGNTKISSLAISLLEHPDVDLKQSDCSGCTALHYAAMFDKTALAKALLDRGADPFQADNSGRIPFDFSRGECVGLFVNSMPLAALVDGKPFANHLLYWLINNPMLWYGNNDVSDFDLSKLISHIQTYGMDAGLRALLAVGEYFFLTMTLIHQGFLIKGLIEKFFIAAVEESIQRRDVVAVRTILKAGRLPFDSVCGSDIFSAIESERELVSVLEDELKEARKVFVPEALVAYKNLAKNLADDRDVSRSVRMDVIDRDFLILIGCGVPGVVEGKGKFDNRIATYLQRINLDKARQLLAGPESPKEKALAAVNMGNNDVIAILKDLAWLEEENGLLCELERFYSRQTVDKLVVNIALDKMYFPDRMSYDGGRHCWVIPHFIDVLQGTQLKLIESLELNVASAQQVIEQIIIELQQTMRWGESYLPQEASISCNILLQSQDLVGTIHSLLPGRSCLIPVATLDHATLLRVESARKGFYRVFFYNTGDGVYIYHPKGGKKGTYQTFIEYAEVPLKNLEDPKIWMRFINNELSNMSAVYSFIDKLCSGGVKQAPLEAPEFYGAVQQFGSCTYQCLLSMLKERLLSSLSNVEEGAALYKIVKGLLHEALEEKTRRGRRAVITNLLQSKVHIMGLEMKIARALADPLLREKLVEDVCLLLTARQLVGIKEKIKQVERGTSFVLFSVFRQALKAIERVDQPIMQESLIKQVVEAKQRETVRKRQGYIEMLDAYLKDPTAKKFKSCIFSLGTQFFGGPLQDVALEWMISRIYEVPNGTNDTTPSVVILKHLIDVFNKQELGVQKELLPPLLHLYEQSGNQTMVAYLESVCNLK